ncbi:unnamed protein product [Ilex paraguariensis]|uniref:CDP-diacylglycerol--glycerol-3-phosphate 1-phosphatidyltransferase n=1 Tax=Ilex paraguariensis TaxID=185542 RepID=A0ABC8SD22_9AQUA
MPALKLTIIASIYATPNKLNKWLRTKATPTVTAIATIKTTSSNTTIGRSSKYLVAWTSGWRISPGAPLIPQAHDKVLYRKLGFRGQKYFYSSEDKGGVVSDMGSENKDDQWFDSAVSPTSPLPPQNQNHHHHRQKAPPPPTSPSKEPQSAKLLTLPTILTIGRVAAIPILVSTFYVDSWWGTTSTTGIFIAAAITDWLDGYLARKMKLGSAFGAFLDPVADKLMVAATLVLLCSRPLEVVMFGQVPWLLTVPSIAIIGREITMSAVREWAASQNGKLSEAVAVNNLGKWKTATQMIALTILLATRDSSLTGAGILAASGVALLYISAWLAVWSLVVYMRKIWKVLLM